MPAINSAGIEPFAFGRQGSSNATAEAALLPVPAGYKRFYWKLQIVTYNLHKIAVPSNEFRPDLLYPVDSAALDYDMIAVGLQELNYLPNNYINYSFFRPEPWSQSFRQFYASRGFAQFTMNAFTEVRMTGIMLLIFVKRELLPLIKKAEIKYVRTGFGGYSGHKGAVCARLTFPDNLHLTFINSHLSTDASNVDYRIWEFQKIMEKCTFDPPYKLTDDDYVFWFGDLNFRVQNISCDDTVELIEHRQFQRLLDFDQLSILRKTGVAFHQFEEAKITFKPTYKYVLGTTQLNIGRMPSYCDRILWRCTARSQANCGFQLAVSPLKYESFIGISCSDHRPVSGAYSCMFYLSDKWSPPIYFEFPSRSRDLHWIVGRSNYCRYVVKENYEPSYFDWIGVFRMDFSSDKDVVTYAYMITAWEEGQLGSRPLQNILFKARFMPPVGLYFLACYSQRSQCLVSISEPFEIIDPQVGARPEFKDILQVRKIKARHSALQLRREDPKKVDLDQVNVSDALLSMSFMRGDKMPVMPKDGPPPAIPNRRVRKRR